MMQLNWHGYRYFPYERELATREIAALFENPEIRNTRGGIELKGEKNSELAERLTYFSRYTNGNGIVDTVQHCLENTARPGISRQATRYSVHGLHEYKGKFNPQVVRALLNIFGIMPRHRVLDPFCGSGTTLVECSHIGANGRGFDINPFAVYLTNAKIKALSTPASTLRDIQKELFMLPDKTGFADEQNLIDPRSRYLQSWFERETLQEIESIRSRIEEIASDVAPVFLAIASDLLRDYSLQDPNDLRMRRRKSSQPGIPYSDALNSACTRVIERIEATQSVLGAGSESSVATHCDITTGSTINSANKFNAAITSPPYAMALPYIETQRLSLVWLNLVDPGQIHKLDTNLIGSREFHGGGRKRTMIALESNEDSLPEPEIEYCRKLMMALSESDGFRRQAVPVLLYRYFALMQRSFKATRKLVRQHAPFALVVGNNHTVLGGARYDINTAGHLANIALSTGWKVDELVPLQTYHRYGYHVKNAIAKETLIVLRNS